MGDAVSQGMVLRALDWGYERALQPGVPVLESAHDLAVEYGATGGGRGEQVQALIRRQRINAASSGFLSGLGGLTTLPVTVPASISSLLYVQTRMVAAIAIMGGYDPRSENVRALVYACLCGKAANDIVSQIGIDIGTKVTTAAVQRLSYETIRQINHRVGFQLASMFSGGWAISLSKAVPVVGGMIGGTLDAVATNTVGAGARRVFIGS